MKKTEIQDDFPYRDLRNDSETRDAVPGRTPWKTAGKMYTLSQKSSFSRKLPNPRRAEISRKLQNSPEEQNPWSQPEAEYPWNQPETVNPRGGSEIQNPLERSAQSEPWEQKSNPQIPVLVQIPDEPVQAQDFSDDDSETVLLRDDGDSETVLLRQPQKISAKLIRINTQEVFSVTTENCKIGKRALMADICIRNNPTISREHCVIRFRDGDYYIEDMDSSNYTYLNGIRVMPGHPKKLQEEIPDQTF